MSTKQKRPSTIYDIAAEARTSISTVSLVLNGSWKRYRIRPETAENIVELAERMGYRADRRARGLRLRRSSLAGMVIPHYRNRFFAGIAETFEEQARARGLCPIVVSAQRDPATERSVVETLVAQQVELIVIVGIDGPDPIDDLCVKAGIPCVNLDLPGSHAPSVVTDNVGGARLLTGWLLDMANKRGGDASGLSFVGGKAGEFATEGRVKGFVEELRAAGLAAADPSITLCGYAPSATYDVLKALAAGPAGLPRGLFINSITAMEGFVLFLRDHPEACRDTAVCCFDWDPFAASLPLPLAMMRQDVDQMIRECFAIIEGGEGEAAREVVVPPTLDVINGPDGF